MANIEAFLAEHGLWTLVGLAIIFMVLAIIRLLISISKSFSGDKSTAQVKATDTVAAPAATTEVASTAASDDTVTAAIITAAIAAYMVEQGVPQRKRARVREAQREAVRRRKQTRLP